MSTQGKVWRVFDGYVAFGNVHRIVLANDAAEAIEKARVAWPHAEVVGFTAELVRFEGDVEAVDYDG